MKNLKSHFRFSAQERSGIFFLLLVIVILQIGYYVVREVDLPDSETTFSIDGIAQAEIDGLKKAALRSKASKKYPFNPNFITDHKGYVLGMGVAEIDRLHQFRAQGQFVNTAADFQKVTGISDSLLARISPYFEFPEWTKGPRSEKVMPRSSVRQARGDTGRMIPIEMRDLNAVTAEQLRAVKGIGEVLSKRIIKFRNRLGGFLVEDQLYDVYGLAPEVVRKILVNHKVFNAPKISKVNINTATASQIASIAYIRPEVAREIVFYREVNGPFSDLNELMKIDRFPADKISRIALYLSL